MSPGRRRLVLPLGIGTRVVLLVVGFVAGVNEQRRLDRARQAEVAERAALRSTEMANVTQNQALHDAYVTGAQLAQDVDQANGDVAVTQQQLASAMAALEQARLVLSSQSSRRAAVEQCLKGVTLALDATARNDSTSATAYLRVAAPSCQTALTPPGEAAPVLAYDFADPFVLRVGSQYFAFATNAAGGSVQEARGRDLSHWDFAGNALANLPSWATPGSVWAPAALARGAVTVLYYTVREKASGNQCISLAISGAPGGPFLDGSSKPLECGSSGAIDPSPFVDSNGAAYLLYKTERPPRLWSRPLTADGLSFAGPAQLVLAPSQRWEAGNVEAPSMLHSGSGYWLFYSGNDWNGRSYAEGVAHCSGPTGPCTAEGTNPILGSRGNTAGPGGGEVFTDAAGGWWLAYHAYQEPLVKYPNSRLLYFARIGFDANGKPTISS
ncbi:MAG: family 43 glycosylhydrolase [Acidimicrobiia bacterium]